MSNRIKDARNPEYVVEAYPAGRSVWLDVAYRLEPRIAILTPYDARKLAKILKQAAKDAEQSA